MSIISAQYIKDEANQNVTIKADFGSDGIIIVPLDTDNRHYAAILEWAKEDGNEIAEAD